MTSILDWDLAQSTARAFARTGPRLPLSEASEVVERLRESAYAADAHVRAFTGLDGGAAHPAVIVDRPQWISINIAGFRQVADPMLARFAGMDDEPQSALANFGRAATAKTAAVQAGGVLAYLSGRVLGQYEVFTGPVGQLLLVAQNIVETERKLDVPTDDFRLWVCLHEVTHRTQFTAVPWLRDHFFAEIRAFAAAGERGSTGRPAANDDQRPLVARTRAKVTTLVEIMRDPHSRVSVLDLVQNPEQRKVIDRLSALMTLVEGHAEFVMDGVGPGIVPSVETIRERFNARRQSGNPLARVVRRLLGAELKLRQYAEGRQFVGDVVEKIGMDGFNQVWSSPETLPTTDELAEPLQWIARVHQG